MDRYEKPSYRNDNYKQPEYPSYQPDYKPTYEKETYKSKDNAIVKKLNCINTNFNTNGDIKGDINTFAPGRTATDSDKADSGADYNGEGDWGYGDGYQNKKDKDFTCIVNNNNTINNIVGGNATDGNVTNLLLVKNALENFKLKRKLN